MKAVGAIGKGPAQPGRFDAGSAPGSYVRPALHVIFWLAVLVFYTAYFGRVHLRYRDSLLFVGLLLPITIATTYVLTYRLIPRYLLARRYLKFALFFAYTLIVSVDLELLLVSHLLFWVAASRAEPMNPAAYDVLNLVVGMYVVVFLGTALNLVDRAFRMQRANQELQRKRLEAELKLKEAELQLLRSQIEPHFLFNTLNSLYALTLERSDQAPEVVLRLSEMLDYVVHRSNEQRVPVAEELDSVANYTALEKTRFGSRVDVRMEIGPVGEEYRMAPLLLIPLVENAFKHGVGKRSQPTVVKIEAETSGHEFRFRVENELATSGGEGPPGGQARGIGLENVRRRLELQYGGHFRFDAGPRHGIFVAELRIDLREQETA